MVVLLLVVPESSHWHPSHDCGTIAGAGTRLISIPRCSLDRLTFKLVQTPGRPLALVAAAQENQVEVPRAGSLPCELRLVARPTVAHTGLVTGGYCTLPFFSSKRSTMMVPAGVASLPALAAMMHAAACCSLEARTPKLELHRAIRYHAPCPIPQRRDRASGSRLEAALRPSRASHPSRSNP